MSHTSKTPPSLFRAVILFFFKDEDLNTGLYLKENVPPWTLLHICYLLELDDSFENKASTAE